MTKSSLKIVLAASTTLGWAAPALAQSSDGASGADIVVTARRIEERLQDVPISITVFNQDQLTDANVTTAQDLATYTPSLSSASIYGSDNSTFALRGFVQETGTAPSVGVYFGDVVSPRGASQGFPAGDGAGPGAFFDLQNVQVLKGPQGTLFGRNTTGGAVVLVPRKPVDRFEGFVEGSLGNFDMRRVQGVINVPLADSVRLRVGGDYQKRDGYLRNQTGIGADDFADVNYYALRGSLVIDVTPDIENYTIFSFSRSHNSGHVQKVNQCNPTPAQTNLFGPLACMQLARQGTGFYNVSNDMPDPYSKMRQWQVINTIAWKVTDDLTIKNINSYAKLRTKTHSDLFGTAMIIPAGYFSPAIPGVFPGFPAVATPIGFAVSRNIAGGYSSNATTFTEEFRLEGTSFGGNLNWQAGAYYEDTTPNGFIGSQSPVTLSCSDPDRYVCTDLLGAGALNYTVAKNSYKTRGIYAQGTYSLTDALKLTVGARYTWDKVRSISRRVTNRFPQGVPNASPFPLLNVTGGAPPPGQSYCADYINRTVPLCEADQAASFKKPTWVIGLDYDIATDMMVYGKYSRGYRAGGVKSDVPPDYVFFDPEKVDTFEIGAKTAFRGAVSGYFNIAAFYNNFTNQQLQLAFFQNFNRRDENGNPLPLLPVTSTAGPVNVGKSRIWGIEIDSQIRPFEGFSISGGYAYLNTKVKEVLIPTLATSDPYAIAGSIRKGDDLAYTPKHKFTATASYTFPVGNDIGDVTIGATYVYSSSQRANYSDRNVAALFGGRDFGIIRPYNLVNLNLSWDNFGGMPLDLSFFATNFLKEKYFTSTSGLLGSAGFSSATLGQPRMWGVRAKYRFGE